MSFNNENQGLVGSGGNQPAFSDMFGANFKSNIQDPNAQRTHEQHVSSSKIEFEDFNLQSEPAFRTNPAPQSTSSQSQNSAFTNPGEQHPFTQNDNMGFSENVGLVGGQQQQQQPTNYHWWNIEYWQFLFNVNTRQVFRRILGALIPFPPKFFEITEQNPDVYGPFWIASTLVFIMSAAGNIGNWLNAELAGESSSWTYDVSKLPGASGFIYGYLGVIPLLLYFFCRYNQIPLQLLQIYCIYGYSMFIYLPISILCVIPRDEIRWGLVGLAFLISTAVLISNIFRALKGHMGKGFIVLIIIALLQLGFALTCMLYFFVY